MKRFNDIENYILNRMTVEERSLLEARMDKDADLKEEMLQTEKLILSIESHGLKQTLKHRTIPTARIDKKINQLQAKRSFNIQRWAAAASIIGIALCTWWYMEINNSQNLKDQYASVFYPDPGLPTSMGETDYYIFYDAMVDYKYGKYQTSLDKWNTITDGIGLDTLTYYKAMAHLGLNNLDASKILLNSINEKSHLYYRANWYLIDILIQQGKITLAKEMLQNMAQHPDYNKKDALDFLNSME